MATDARSSHRSLRAAAGAAVLAIATGCAGMGAAPPAQMVVPPSGWLFAKFSAPLTQNFQGNPTGQSVRVVQERHVRYFHDFLITGLGFAWDSATIERIAREGGIKTVSYADYEFMHVLGVFGVTTIRVYGI
jgi:hypothetical protein